MSEPIRPAAAPEPAPVAVFDIDGVLADVRHRLCHVRAKPKDWQAFFAAAVRDQPHPQGLALLREMARDHDVLLLTGRPEHTRPQTQAWLESHGVGSYPLHMRPAGDRRPAAVVKRQFLRGLVRTRAVALVVDDDPVVVETLRAAGFDVHHADWERRAEQEQAALLEAQEVDGRS
ncbi:MAG TPA: hypothetical protein VNU01_01855 [Egibacteraceae bacterium]|nr:hypothetical protein [Egibacteraceae bacterium]